MNLKRALTDLFRTIVTEAEHNPEFARRLEEALRLDDAKAQSRSEPRSRHTPLRAANRRTPAVLDPIELARQGEAVLRARLSELTLDQLKDIIADFGMDPGKLVLKWKTPERVIDRIVEVSIGRARKGEGFLSPGRGGT